MVCRLCRVELGVRLVMELFRRLMRWRVVVEEESSQYTNLGGGETVTLITQERSSSHKSRGIELQVPHKKHMLLLKRGLNFHLLDLTSEFHLDKKCLGEK